MINCSQLGHGCLLPGATFILFLHQGQISNCRFIIKQYDSKAITICQPPSFSYSCRPVSCFFLPQRKQLSHGARKNSENFRRQRIPSPRTINRAGQITPQALTLIKPKFFSKNAIPIIMRNKGKIMPMLSNLGQTLYYFFKMSSSNFNIFSARGGSASGGRFFWVT